MRASLYSAVTVSVFSPPSVRYFQVSETSKKTFQWTGNFTILKLGPTIWSWRITKLPYCSCGSSCVVEKIILWRKRMALNMTCIEYVCMRVCTDWLLSLWVVENQVSLLSSGLIFLILLSHFFACKILNFDFELGRRPTQTHILGKHLSEASFSFCSQQFHLSLSFVVLSC